MHELIAPHSTCHADERLPRRFMAFLASLSAKEMHRYHQVVTHSMDIRSHFDLLVWLQGDLQRYVPHDIWIAAWGDFQAGDIQHDIISPLAGVRSSRADAAAIAPLLRGLFRRWLQFDKQPYALKAGDEGFALDRFATRDHIGNALQRMRWVMVHGIVDERGSHDCLYAAFSATTRLGNTERSAMASVLPYVDTALRQITHLPPQNAESSGPIIAKLTLPTEKHGLSEREAEILQWVAMGKTNGEIASILDISAFTVKNHMQRVFQKLDVTNRAQAVSKLISRAPQSHVQG